MGEPSHDIYAEAAKLRARIETLEISLRVTLGKYIGDLHEWGYIESEVDSDDTVVQARAALGHQQLPSQEKP